MARIEIDIDDELLGRAAHALGTQEAADTVLAALQAAAQGLRTSPVDPTRLPGREHPFGTPGDPTAPPIQPQPPGPPRRPLPDFPTPPEIR